MADLSRTARRLLNAIQLNHVDVFGAGNLSFVEDLFLPEYHSSGWCARLNELGEWADENTQRSARERRQVIDEIVEAIRGMVNVTSVIDDDFRKRIQSIV